MPCPVELVSCQSVETEWKCVCSINADCFSGVQEEVDAEERAQVQLSPCDKNQASFQGLVNGFK